MMKQEQQTPGINPNFESLCLDQRKQVPKRVSIRACFVHADSIISDLQYVYKVKNPYGVIYSKDIQMAACEVGISLLRKNEHIQAYIKELQFIRCSSKGDSLEFKNLESSKESYDFLHGSTWRSTRKILCSEKEEHRLGELANDCKIYSSVLLPMCQLYGLDFFMNKFGYQCEQLETDVMEELLNIELFLKMRVINLWLKFWKHEIDYGGKTIIFEKTTGVVK